MNMTTFSYPYRRDPVTGLTTAIAEEAYRWDLSYFKGPRIALVRMDTADQRFSANVTLMSYVVTPQS
jgi:hypothetical protein